MGKAFVNHTFIMCGVRKNKDRGAVQPRFGTDDRLPWKLTSAIMCIRAPPVLNLHHL